MAHMSTPEQFFGHPLGADRSIARWDQIVDYYRHLEQHSDRLQVREMGRSTEGHPFLLLYISSPGNLASLDHIQTINRTLSQGVGPTPTTDSESIREGKVIVCQSMSLHANEIGGTQMAPQLTYDLLTSDSEETQLILDNVVFLMIPCFNPDGQIMITDWYREQLGTTYEGCGLPWLYHSYAGHDNNRDAFMLNLVESQYMARILFREWQPQVYQDHHHMGSYGPRFYVAPYSNPIHPHADPLIWREHAWLGSHMAMKLEESGVQGVANGVQFPGWGHLGFHWITAYHNIAGMLTESANAKLASPLFIHPSQLTGVQPLTMPEYQAQVDFPHPWPGGWWRLEDIVKQKYVAAWSLLEFCGRHRTTLLQNAHRKAARQRQRGLMKTPRCFVIPAGGHDPLTTDKLVRRLLDQGIEMSQSTHDFTIESQFFPAGSVLIETAQPKRGLILTLLQRTHYPKSPWTQTSDGTPTVFDTASDTLAEYMGVDVVECSRVPDVKRTPLSHLPVTPSSLTVSEVGYWLDARCNDTYQAVNVLLQDEIPVQRSSHSIDLERQQLPPGAFYVPDSERTQDLLRDLADELGIEVYAATQPNDNPLNTVTQRRVGIYQRYWGGNADEGWTRLVLEQFGFPYITLRDEDIRDPGLRDRVDVVILPHDPRAMIHGIDQVDEEERARLGWFEDHLPPEYRSGIGSAGVESLGRFVRQGGRLVAFDGAWIIAQEACDLKVSNRVADRSAAEYLTHGSTLRLEVDVQHPLGFGMPERALLLSWDSAVFEVKETFRAEQYEVVARFPESDLLQSGRLVGETLLAAQTAVLRIDCGAGDVILLGGRVQHRGQTHGTFKLLFNALL